MRILLADDHKIVRDGLRSLIEKHPGLEVVAEADDGRKAVSLTVELSPDVVIMDVAMPSLNGIEATRRIVSEKPGVGVVALSMHSDRRYVIEMFRAGAMGYLLKDCAFEELTFAIDSVVRKKFYLSPEVADMFIKDCVFRNDSPPAYTVLTSREREVLQLLAEGKSTTGIADALNVSEKTVETHRRQIMIKLKKHSIAELTKYAIREGLTMV